MSDIRDIDRFSKIASACQLLAAAHHQVQLASGILRDVEYSDRERRRYRRMEELVFGIAVHLRDQATCARRELKQALPAPEAS